MGRRNRERTRRRNEYALNMAYNVMAREIPDEDTRLFLLVCAQLDIRRRVLKFYNTNEGVVDWAAVYASSSTDSEPDVVVGCLVRNRQGVMLGIGDVSSVGGIEALAERELAGDHQGDQ